MAVSAVGTDFSNVHSVGTGQQLVDASGTIPSGATITIAIAVWNNHGEDLGTVTWDPTGNNEAFTKIVETTLDGDSSDVAVSIWGLVSPTPATALVRGDWGGSPTNPCAILYCRSYSGTPSDTVANATNVVGSATDKTGTGNTTTISSGGSSGNLLLFGGGGVGADMVPASNAESWTEISDSLTSGGGAGNNQDCSIYIAEKAAAAGITVTWGATDECAGHVIELVAAGSGALLMRAQNEGLLR